STPRTVLTLFTQLSGSHLHLHSFPTRRSSDLNGAAALFPTRVVKPAPGNQQTTIRDCKNINEIFLGLVAVLEDARHGHIHAFREDRKSTRLNSSHVKISYAVFCLKKKTPEQCE